MNGDRDGGMGTWTEGQKNTYLYNTSSHSKEARKKDRDGETYKFTHVTLFSHTKQAVLALPCKQSGL